MVSKAELRAIARRNRAALRVDHAMVRVGLARHLRRLRAERPDGVTVLYAPMPGEPRILELADADGELGRFALTRTPGEPDVPLTIHALPCALETHRFGFEQPVEHEPVVDDGEIDVVCVPGLVFDRHGGRLGFGAGYYDRLLARFAPGTQFIGISNGHLVERIPAEDHDIAMTHLATEIGVVPFPLGPGPLSGP